MKSTLLNAGIIIGASVVIALVYNALSPQPLDLVRKKIELPSASDSALFADTPAAVDTAMAAASSAQDSPVAQPPAVDKSATPEHQTAQPQGGQSAAGQPPAGQSAANQEASEEKPTVKNVTYEQVVRLSKDPSVLFIDARNADEYSQGHIGNARNYFTHDFEKHIPEIVQIDREKRIVVYCGGGACELSHEMADNLLNFGFKRVFVYTGGWDEWKKNQGVN